MKFSKSPIHAIKLSEIVQQILKFRNEIEEGNTTATILLYTIATLNPIETDWTQIKGSVRKKN